MFIPLEMVLLLFSLLGACIALLLVPPRRPTLSSRETIIARDLPIPVWWESEEGIVWTNRAYDGLVALNPQTPLFPPAASRVRLQSGDGERWFSVRRDGAVGHAFPIEAHQKPEPDARQIVQALAKAFAHLPIGLAVFDRDRHLQMFNPSLCDLTALSPEFLGRKPSMVSILDSMRNRKTVPEPKDWKSWRRQIVEMERAAATGRYEETWVLPSGRTYRVTGRPYPDGELALMIEDISVEVSRSQRYRADLDMCQAVIDMSDEAIAVFAASGQLVLSNAAYAALWGKLPDGSVRKLGIDQLVSLWRSQSAPTQLWSDLLGYVGNMGTRQPWGGEIRLVDGRLISCRITPLADGATLAGFRIQPTRLQPKAVAGSA